jgi:hypothetical protein
MKGLARAVLGGCTMGLLLVAPAFAADTPKAEPPAELIPKVRPTTKTFYGWQILATGSVGAVLATAAVVLPNDPITTTPSTAAFLTGMPLFVLGGPAVHWSHQDFSKGLVSFGGNIVLPMIGGFAGRAIRCGETNPPDSCETRGFLTGLTVTAIATSIVDALVLGWEDVPVDDMVSRASHRPLLLSLAPWLTTGRQGTLEAGLAGSF